MDKSKHISMGRQKCSVSLWGIRQEVSSSVYFCIHPEVSPLYPCSQYLGGPEVLRLSQRNLLFYPLLQSYGGPQVHCAAGESAWSKQGDKGMTELENASSTARTGLALLGGWRRQSCCLQGHVPSLMNKGARDCRRAESFSFQSFLCFSRLPVFHLIFVPASWWFSQASLPAVRDVTKSSIA